MKNIISVPEKKQLQDLLCKYPQIISVYLFGSRVKSTDKPKSDLDVGIVCLDKKEISPLEMGETINKIIPKYDTDISVSDFNGDPLLLIQIINGKLIYQKNLKARLLMETQILHLYEDYQILRKISKYYLEKSFKKGVYAH